MVFGNCDDLDTVASTRLLTPGFASRHKQRSVPQGRSRSTSSLHSFSYMRADSAPRVDKPKQVTAAQAEAEHEHVELLEEEFLQEATVRRDELRNLEELLQASEERRLSLQVQLLDKSAVAYSAPLSDWRVACDPDVERAEEKLLSIQRERGDLEQHEANLQMQLLWHRSFVPFLRHAASSEVEDMNREVEASAQLQSAADTDAGGSAILAQLSADVDSVETEAQRMRLEAVACSEELEAWQRLVKSSAGLGEKAAPEAPPPPAFTSARQRLVNNSADLGDKAAPEALAPAFTNALPMLETPTVANRSVSLLKEQVELIEMLRAAQELNRSLRHDVNANARVRHATQVALAVARQRAAVETDLKLVEVDQSVNAEMHDEVFNELAGCVAKEAEGFREMATSGQALLEARTQGVAEMEATLQRVADGCAELCCEISELSDELEVRHFCEEEHMAATNVEKEHGCWTMKTVAEARAFEYECRRDRENLRRELWGKLDSAMAPEGTCGEPPRDDAVDAMLVAHVEERPPQVPFFRLSTGVYLFGTRRVMCCISHAGHLVFRVEGGFCSYDGLLEKYGPSEALKQNTL